MPHTTCKTRHYRLPGRALLFAASWLVMASWGQAAQEVTDLPLRRVLVIDTEGPTRPAFVQFMEG
ncbi:MAG: hypothetical protein EBZ13_12705, partial [Planctomycetia bacterium]|nr:hypothetical protein [Planctomycetia bacterium]